MQGARGKLDRSTSEDSGAMAGVDTCDRRWLLELAERLPDDEIQADVVGFIGQLLDRCT